MCTLTYIPTSGKGKIITANRDESPLRNAHKLSDYYTSQGEKYLIAKEPFKGGTNVAISPDKRMSVLLNGAFAPHKMGGNYVKSRGIMLLESLEYGDIFHFAQEESLQGIEPFTLVEFQEAVREIRWDGQNIYEKTVDANQPQIWASAQLYSSEVIRKRQEWFENLISKNPNQEDVLDFHFHEGEGDPENDLVMNRSGLVRTVSITQLAVADGNWSVRHFDLVQNTEQTL
jgi:hypothetical protein